MYTSMLAVIVLSMGCRDEPATPPATSTPRPVRTIVIAHPPALAEPVTPASLWSAAAAEGTADSWAAVASALQRELDQCTKNCLFLAHEVVEAREKVQRIAGEDSMDEHEDGPVPPYTRATIDAMDAYVRLAPPSDPEVKHLQLMTTLTLDYRDQLAAIPRLETFVTTYHDDERSMVTSMLLDSLVRNGRTEELRRVSESLLADPEGLDESVLARLHE